MQSIIQDLKETVCKVQQQIVQLELESKVATGDQVI